MADELKYKIHSVSVDEVPVILKLASGENVEAKIKYLVVEAVSDCELMGHTFRIRGGDVANYPVGADLLVQLIPGDSA